MRSGLAAGVGWFALACATFAQTTSADAVAPGAGGLVVVEIGANPTLAEPDAEYLEVWNPGESPVSLEGLILFDDTTASAPFSDVALDPGQRIAVIEDLAMLGAGYNCSVTPYALQPSPPWPAMSNSAADSIGLKTSADTVVDTVTWPAGTFNTAGNSWELDPDSWDATANDNASNWSTLEGQGDDAPCDVGPPRPGTLSFDGGPLTIEEGAAPASVTVERAEGTNGSVSAGISTGGTASQGADYTAPASATLGPGDSAQSLQVAAVDDAVDEPDETATLTLQGPTGGAAIGAPATVTVTIVDNDAPSPGGSGGGATAIPALDLIAPLVSTVARSQRALKKKALVFTLNGNEAFTLNATARLGKAKLGSIKRSLPRGRSTVTLKLSRKGVSALKKALRRKKTAVASLKLTFADSAGNSSGASRKVKIRR